MIRVGHGAGLVHAYVRRGRKRNDDGLNQYRSWIAQPVLSELTVWVPLVWHDIAVAHVATSRPDLSRYNHRFRAMKGGSRYVLSIALILK